MPDPISIPPHVRHMLLCEDISVDPRPPHRVTIHGLTTVIRRTDPAKSFPLTHSFVVCAMITGGRGTGMARIVVAEAETNADVYVGTAHEFEFRNDPLTTSLVRIRVPACTFSDPGLYWVELWYNGDVIASEPLVVR